MEGTGVERRWPTPRAVDPFEENKSLGLIVGYAPTNESSYIAYRVAVIIFYSFIHCTAIYTLYLVSSDKYLTADVIHIYTVSVWHFWCLGSRLITEKSLMKMREMICSGIYLYEEEDLDEEQRKMQRAIGPDIKRKSFRLMSIYIFGFFSIMIVCPLTEYIMNREQNLHKQHIINPYLPHPTYYPFNTFTVVGFVSAYAVDFIYWIYVYSTSVVNNGLFISSTVHLRVHFNLLNYSIMNIQRRAYKLFARNHTDHVTESSLEELLRKKDFRKCLKLSLHANIQHHQTLIRFKKTCQPFNGLTLLNMFTVTVVIYAAMLYLLLQDIPMSMKIKYAGTFVAEQTYAFYICNFGQEVTTESSALFEALYSTTWMDYDKEFQQTLHIMMSNAKTPMEIKTFFLDFSATLESYSELLSAIYKVMSLWRQSDSVK